VATSRAHSRPCLHTATLAGQPWRNVENTAQGRSQRSHSAMPRQVGASMAAHECGLCLAAGWDAGPGQPETGQTL
jgi:hypothetical protein